MGMVINYSLHRTYYNDGVKRDLQKPYQYTFYNCFGLCRLL